MFVTRYILALLVCATPGAVATARARGFITSGVTRSGGIAGPSYTDSWTFNGTADDLDGDAIASGEVRSGAIGGIADLDAFTFTGMAGDRVRFGALEGTAAPFNATLSLYPPAGGSVVFK